MMSVGAVPWVHAEVLRRGLVDAAQALRSEGVELIAVKGIYLVFVLGVDPTERPMMDADAIVARGSFHGAVRTLVASGEWRAYEGWSSKVLERTDGRGGVVDLHRMALPLFFGALRSEALRRRGHRPAAFDGQVLAPEATDAACLAVAHFVKDLVGQVGHGGLARDLDALAERGRVAPAELAARLREHRLRRVGLVAFSALAGTHARWTPWLDALRPSRAERFTSDAAVNAVRRLAPEHPDAAFLLVRALGDNPAISTCGFAATAARLLRDRAKGAWTTMTNA
jgi:hypothetical protein